MDLDEILNRRSDLSTFLVHLTRDFDASQARDNLRNIIGTRRIEARTVFGHLKHRLANMGQNVGSQRCVCFTETPLEYTHLLTAQIEHRQFRFAPYGIALTKKVARARGVNPVWYVDMTPGHEWLTNNLDRLAQRFIDGGFADHDLGGLFPFIDHMGSGRGAAGEYRKEFWWEREWRHVGDFALQDTVICLCPEADISFFERALKDAWLNGSCIDPLWSLEKIIARLAGFRSEEIDMLPD
jgi:Putative abortive phage resistance protein AbiGi, antitoxin